jgi:hypothetical protein
VILLSARGLLFPSILLKRYPDEDIALLGGLLPVVTVLQFSSQPAQPGEKAGPVWVCQNPTAGSDFLPVRCGGFAGASHFK